MKLLNLTIRIYPAVLDHKRPSVIRANDCEVQGDNTTTSQRDVRAIEPIILGWFMTINMLIFGFARDLHTALVARALGGILNGKIGVLQTTVTTSATMGSHLRVVSGQHRLGRFGPTVSGVLHFQGEVPRDSLYAPGPFCHQPSNVMYGYANEEQEIYADYTMYQSIGEAVRRHGEVTGLSVACF